MGLGCSKWARSPWGRAGTFWVAASVLAGAGAPAARLRAQATLGSVLADKADRVEGPAPGGYQSLIDEGVAEFARGNWSEARAFFRRAHALRPSARTLRGLGFVAYELKDYVAAERMLTQALASDVHPLSDRQREQTKAMLSKVGALIGRFTLSVTPFGSTVTVDGHLRTVVDGPLPLNVGPHLLVVRHDGYRELEVRVDVQGGEGRTLELSLRPLPQLDRQAVSDGRLLQGASPQPQDSLLQSPWLWTGLAALVVGGAAAGVVFAVSGDEAPGPVVPRSGVTIMTLGASR